MRAKITVPVWNVSGILLTTVCMTFASNFAYGATNSSMEIPKHAMNCDLKVPPDGPGENFVHGTYLFIYPRQVSNSYTGCQIMWADDGARWMALYLEKGHPKLLQVTYPFDSEAGKYVCKYENDSLVNADQKFCNAFNKNEPFGDLLFKSVDIPEGSVAFHKLRDLQRKK